MAEDNSTATDIVYLDLETSVDCPIGNNKAHFAWPANHVVAAGSYSTEQDTYYSKLELIKDSGVVTHMDGVGTVCVVGHNVPFDINHYRKAMFNPEDTVKLRQTMTRDTAIAEYLLSAQQSKFPSLDELAAKYGLPLKDNKLKVLWDSGTRTEDIHSSILLPYLKQDVMNTRAIFEKQVVALSQKGMMNLYKSQCDAQMAVTEMMYNGMKVNRFILEKMIARAELEIVQLQEMFIEAAEKTSIRPLDVGDMDSPKALSLLFFGGKIKGTRKVPAGKYKNGNDKFVTEKVEAEVKGLGEDPTVVGAELGKNGYYSVDEKVLSTISTFKTSSLSTQIADIVLKYRTVKKELSTYLLPIRDLIFPDGCIHGNINTTATTTGRYSSSNPNLQNITDFSNIKTMFTSRWGEGGVIIEADFNQLEIVALAYLSQDRQLIKDINSGVDIHTALYKSAFGGVAPTKPQRKAFKSVSFALIYGAGVNTIHEQTKLPRSSVRAFCDAFMNRYPDVIEWWERMRQAVLKNRLPNPNVVVGEVPHGISTIQAGTGRLLTFREYASDYVPGTMSFSPSQIKNYPVQSFATGDVVPMVLGRVYKALMNSELLRDSCVLVNTVHDSIVLDCKKEVYNAGVGLLMEVMPKVKEYLAEDFGITDFNVNIGVSIRVGSSWKENKETDLTFEAVCRATD